MSLFIKIKAREALLIFSVGILINVSCKKNIDSSSQVSPSELPDLSTKINASVSGFVVDENGAAAKGATVSFGNSNTITDEYGFFEFTNVNVVQTAAVVSIDKMGYFKSIKTFAAVAGKPAFFRVKLMPKTIAGTVSSSGGGDVSLPNGLSVTLPPNATINATSNAPYNGTIHMSVAFIDPLAGDLDEIMPGDLRGIDRNGQMKGLTTFGMAAIELSGDAGERLQLAAGKKATLTMPMSSQVLAGAPASIPLWYFNETDGLWKEDGSANKTGNSFVGEVSHFSFWNCDLPNATVPLTFTVLDENGNGVGNIHVEITPVPGSANSWSHIGGSTDPSGYVSVFLTANTEYNFALSTFNCLASPFYTKTFSAANIAVSLGNILVPTGSLSSISGTATDCNNNPLTNGRIYYKSGAYFSACPLNAAGAFNFSMPLCSNPDNTVFEAIDLGTAQYSNSINFPLSPGNNNIGNLQACGTGSGNKFINYTIDGMHYFFNNAIPGDTIGFFITTPVAHDYYVFGNDYFMPNTTSNVFAFDFTSPGIGVNSVQTLTQCESNLCGHYFSTNVPVNITEYDIIQKIVAGNFTGSFTDSFSNPHTVSCSFRAKNIY